MMHVSYQKERPTLIASEPPIYFKDLAPARAALATLQVEIKRLTDLSIRDTISHASGETQPSTETRTPFGTAFSATQNASNDEREFVYSPCFRSVRIEDRAWTLTANQSEIVRTLYMAWIAGTPDVSVAYLLETLESEGFRYGKLKDVFKHDREAMRALITSGRKKGTVRLNLARGAGDRSPARV